MFASFVLAAYHYGLATRIAFLASHERLCVAERAGRRQRPSASGAHGVAAYDGLQAVRALEPERASASALGAETTVPFDHLSAVYARLFVCGHMIPHETYHFAHRTWTRVDMGRQLINIIASATYPARLFLHISGALTDLSDTAAGIRPHT